MTPRTFIPCALLVCLIASAGCSGSAHEIRLDAPVKLTVRFQDDHLWDGKEIPHDGRCRDCGGRGRSPALIVGGLPPQATYVEVEFNDLRIPDLSEFGGHGVLGVATGGRAEVVLPSVPEETMDLPRGVICVRKHRCARYGHKAGAFKAPCGCGQGNRYVALVKAVYKKDGAHQVLAEQQVEMGVF